MLKTLALFQLLLILGFMIACVNQLGGAMGGETNDYFKALLFDGTQAVLSLNISAAAVAGRSLLLRRFFFWLLVIISVTLNIYYKWTLINPNAPGFVWSDLAMLSAFDLYVQIATNIVLGAGIVILTETRNDTLKDVAFFMKEETRLERQRTLRALKREELALAKELQGESIRPVNDAAHNTRVTSQEEPKG